VLQLQAMAVMGRTFQGFPSFMDDAFDAVSDAANSMVDYARRTAKTHGFQGDFNGFLELIS